MANELRGLFVGPMPVSQFLDDFLPAADDASFSAAAPQFVRDNAGDNNREGLVWTICM
jgi:hypothetical protein